jgi:para-nitrobenzyl esterase
MAAGTGSNDRVTTANGIVEGTTVPGSQIRVFKGIPYAQPPVGDLRWKAPQPPLNWNGVLQAHDFGPRAMQLPLFGDMVFRSRGMSEDCLYLNVWTPARSAHEHLPVLVYFYGGGFAAGDGSELRYDGESMARRGIVALTVNYRLGIFGFLAHPELTRESPNYASGNYGLMDQSAALQWVQKNIAAFGGDPNRVTIAGQSAGSFSVCAQMASPLSRNLIAGAIGESGSLIGMWPPTTLVDAEINGVTFANKIGAPTIAALRAIPATQLLDDVGKTKGVLFGAIVDGYFMPKDPEQIFAAGQQAHVPLLIGWNSEESGPDGVLKGKPATPENYIAAVQKMQPDRAADLLKLYPGTTPDEVLQSATDLASDRGLGYSTWKWCDMQIKTGGKSVYRYFYTHPRPSTVSSPGNPASGAVHSAEIEYAMGNLATNKVFAWTPDDYKLSATLQGYFANFIKTGDPNGATLPAWPKSNDSGTGEVMHLDIVSGCSPEQNRARYLLLDQIHAANKVAGH